MQCLTAAPLQLRSLRVSSSIRGLVIEFSDNGRGITSANLAKIWEPFFTTKEEGMGTGLGLGICRRIVEEHGGTIAIESEQDAGTSVTIILPTTSTAPVSAMFN